MRKLSLSELGRMTIEEHKKAQKLPVTIILDNLRSQHNIGAIFRTADAFRLEEILLCGITATPPQREIQKSALGATESVAWRYFKTTLAAVNELKNKGYLLVAVEQTEGSVHLDTFHFSPDSKMALIFGNEVSGIEQEVLNIVDICVEIPQYGTKHSLNVSVSGGIVIWEVFCKLALDQTSFSR